MRRLTIISVTLAASLLAGACAAAGEAPELPPAQSCSNEAGKPFIGREASAEVGAEMLRATGTSEIRWVPPGTAVTMDYREGRLTVSYDERRIITQVSCG